MRIGDPSAIVGVSGSTRPGSRTSAALRIVLAGAAAAGATTDLIDLAELHLPFFDGDTVEYPEPVSILLRKVRHANGLVLGSPVYHDTMSGAMKNALDLLQLLARDTPPWLTGRPVGLVAVAGGGPGCGVHALDGMQHACRALRAWTLPAAVVVPGTVLESNGNNPGHQELDGRLHHLGRQLAWSTAMLTRGAATLVGATSHSHVGAKEGEG
jgi:FMN reductase